MIKSVNKILKKFGYDLKKKHSGLIKLNQKSKKHKSSGLIIEFTGLSGIGKSTLFNQIWPFYKNDWISRKEIEHEAHTNSLEFLDKKASLFYEKLLAEKFKNLSKMEDITFSKKVLFFDYFEKSLKNDAHLKSLLWTKGVFLDEGVIHIFTDEIVEIINSNSISENILKEFFEGRAIIYLESGPDYVIEHLKKRSVENPRANNWHQTLGDEKFRAFHKKSVENKANLMSIAKKYGSHTLILNMELLKNHELIEKIKKFIFDIEGKN